MLGQLSMPVKITERRLGDEGSILTCFRLHWKVGLSLEDAIDNFSTVPIGWVVSISGSDLDHKRACNDRNVTENKEGFIMLLDTCAHWRKRDLN